MIILASITAAILDTEKDFVANGSRAPVVLKKPVLSQ